MLNNECKIIQVLLGIVFLFNLLDCKAPVVENPCEPGSKQNWTAKLILQALTIRTPNTSCLNYAPFAKVNIIPLYANGKMLKGNTPLEFVFDQYVSGSRCSLSLGISNDSFTKKFEKISDSASKMILTPLSIWSSSIDRELGIFCIADNGNETVSPYQIKYSFASDYRFVSTKGSDTSSGITESEPLATIQTAISRLSSSSECGISGNACFVLVGNGSYTANSTITALNQISLYGSYSDDFLSRNADPTATSYTPSIITDTRLSTGGTTSSPISTILVTGSVNKTYTEINGFHIKPPTGGAGYSAAIWFNAITNTGIVFKSNKIEIQNPGSAYGVYTDSVNSGDLISNLIQQTGTFTGSIYYSVYLNSTGIGFSSIDSNTITQGTCSTAGCAMHGIALNTTSGVSIISKNKINLGNVSANAGIINGIFPSASNSTPAMTISGNTIKGTSCTGSGCIVSGLNLNVPALNNKLTISGNDINPGSCTLGSCETRGIYITGSNSTDLDILSNTINGGDSTATTSGGTFGLKMNTAISSFINFQYNTVNPGASQSGFGVSVGLRIGATGSYAGKIASNVISGGSGNLVFALWGSPSSNILIERNIFKGGSTNSAGNATIDINLGNNFLSNLVIAGSEISGPNGALKISGGNGKIFQNTLVGRGTGSNAYALQFSAANTVDIISNLIVTESGATNRYCVYEDVAGVGPTIFSDNALFNCPTGYYFDPDSPNATKNTWCAGTFGFTGCINPLAGPAGTSNLSPVDPMFFDATNSKYCLSSSSPSSITSGTANNIVSTDLTGASRPTGNRAYGAYEPGSKCD